MSGLTYLSLFSGIGGLDLGLDRAGWTCVGQVEKDDFCRRVLAKHWPEVPRHDDVRTTPGWWLGATRPAVHLVAGGFPCQPFSSAGRQEGIADERWGWPWFADVVRAVRPEYVLVENVAALLRDADAFGRILADLAEGGYDADWDCIPAAAVGAPHRRDRLFLVAHTHISAGAEKGPAEPKVGRTPVLGAGATQPRGRRSAVAYADHQRPQGCRLPEAEQRRSSADTDRGRTPVFGPAVRQSDGWPAEPGVGRVAHGISARVDRLRALGNAVVPQVGERVGRLILAGAVS